MNLPIVAFGSPILRKVAVDIDATYPNFEQLLANMWNTLYNSNGVGLAAPQINKSIRLFIIDSAQIFANVDDEDKEEITAYTDAPGIVETFINAHIVTLAGEPWAYNEGCLSIPKIREDVMRPQTVTLTYQNANWETFTTTFTGITARIILHEYDHLEGKLFIDYISPLKKRLIKGKLNDISKLKTRTDYRMVLTK